MTPPPGWYAAPHAPHLERWWDGRAWTEHRRTPSGLPAPPPPAAGVSGRARAVALTSAAAVLATAIVCGATVLRTDEASGRADTTVRTAPGPAAPPDRVVDQLNGISLPVPAGWTGSSYPAQDDVVMTTAGTYACPARTGRCRHGQVISLTAGGADGASPRTVAERDVPEAAEAAYGHDPGGRRPFGGIRSHRVVKAGRVAVAGRDGYLVRWRVRTADGPGGYVQAVAFPSATGIPAPVVVRLVLDAGPDGPPLSDMDAITSGIRPVGDQPAG
ncbi:DUF2510 domain-containing protein [Streptomyces shenzhenensis]|uniref:DUF2510 domain-containing protein n=1 Tax=Streptomyces shenzhenensis TaxID=943815 RepID=UPI001F2FD519|nr:DUF2510 domain-containing protein [Streptomyces shenzhenensis]